MALSREQLYEALVETGGVNPEDFQVAEKAREMKERGIDGVLIASGKITDEQVGQLIADWYGVPFVNVAHTTIENGVLQLIPESFARKKLVIPVAKKAEEIRLAVSDPSDVVLRALLEKYLRTKVVLAYATPRDLKSSLFLYRRDPKSVFEGIIEQAQTDEKSNVIIDLVDAIFNYAYQASASDIHIEPEDTYTVVRYRVDGILKDIADLPKEMHESIVTRLKVLARLATDEHRAAQDGRISIQNEFGEEIDIRISIVPTTNGEKSVMRLLTDKASQYSLADLGMGAHDLKIFRTTIKKPWGMILVTGPTGSGKTTSLYAALKVLNRREVNIATIEDPVEFDLDGINQIQVNPKTNLTFAKGLRSIVRQDPDIIMVGEIRDGETAGIAVNAAMTGHLVFSTLHTNDAATAFPRLKDMGVEDFLISSTAVGIMAQRLVRTICLRCIYSQRITKKELAMLKRLSIAQTYLKDITKKTSLAHLRTFAGKGCKSCGDTGYRGRSGIFEILTVSDVIREAVMQDRNAEEIKRIALKEGMRTMLYDGLQKAVTGVTTLEEVLRVTQE